MYQHVCTYIRMCIRRCVYVHMYSMCVCVVASTVSVTYCLPSPYLRVIVLRLLDFANFNCTHFDK